MKTPLLSILLPTHNRADVVGFAIQSALAQTFDDFELLVVGDGCTDETESIVQGFTAKDTRVKWFPFPKAAGFGYANRNTALQKARGKYVAYLGHDDVWLPNHLEVMAEFFKTNANYLIAYTQPLWMSDVGVIVPSFYNTNAPHIREVFWNYNNEIPAICVVVQRAALEKAGYWIPGTKNAGDWDLWRRIISLDSEEKIGFVSTPTTINFRSNWRKDVESLNDQLRIQLRMLQSSPLLQFFKVPQPKHDEPLQKATWLQVQKAGWLEKLLATIPLVEDELMYKITEELFKVTSKEGTALSLKRRLKETQAYRSYLTLKPRWRK